MMNLSRRTFVKGIAAMAASLMVPVIRLRDTIDREKILKSFCDLDPEGSFSRFDLREPFGVGSLTYASEGRHIIRAEIENRVEDGERRLPRDIEGIWKTLWHPGEFRPFQLPPIESLTLGGGQRYAGICPLCDGRRVSFGDSYPDFEIEHKLAIHNGYDPDDNSIFDPSCPLCQGKNYYGPCELVICGIHMNYSRAKLIASVPNVMVAPNISSIQPYGPLIFKGDGFEGAAMGLSR